jgi:hypothetical protein
MDEQAHLDRASREPAEIDVEPIRRGTRRRSAIGIQSSLEGLTCTTKHESASTPGVDTRRSHPA